MRDRSGFRTCVEVRGGSSTRWWRTSPVRACLRFPLLLVLVACTTTRGEAPTPQPAAQPRPAETDRRVADGGDVLRRALSEAVAHPGSWSDLHLAVECQGESGARSLVAFGNGVALWNNRRQLTLTLTELTHLLSLLEDADFGGLANRYGGRKAPPGGSVEGEEGPENAILITCRVELTLNGVRKEVVQLAKGEQSPIFKRLAESLLDFCQEQGEAGVAAADLSDGLEKVARGELAPEVLGVLLHRKPDAASALEGGQGFLLRLTGRHATTRPYDPAEGYGEVLELELSPAEMETLARSLVDLTPASLPGNLWARDYTDLTVRIFDHRKSVQARQFTGLTRFTHGQRQRDFESIVGVLQELHLRVLNAGRPAAANESAAPGRRDES